MSHDVEISVRIDHLLLTDPRLAVAAPLIGRVPAVVTEPKAERKPRKPRKVKGKKRPPPRPGSEMVDIDAPAPDPEEDEAPTRPGAPWLKVARAKRVPDEMRAALGGEALAMIVVDGGLWLRLDDVCRDAALILALRSLRWEEREKDGADLCKREVAPLQTWPDCVAELSNLVVALTDNPAQAASDSRAVEEME